MRHRCSAASGLRSFAAMSRWEAPAASASNARRRRIWRLTLDTCGRLLKFPRSASLRNSRSGGIDGRADRSPSRRYRSVTGPESGESPLTSSRSIERPSLKRMCARRRDLTTVANFPSERSEKASSPATHLVASALITDRMLAAVHNGRAWGRPSEGSSNRCSPKSKASTCSGAPHRGSTRCSRAAPAALRYLLDRRSHSQASAGPSAA